MPQPYHGAPPSPTGDRDQRGEEHLAGTKPTRRERALAITTVMAHAHDLDDCTELLMMLGLDTLEEK